VLVGREGELGAIEAELAKPGRVASVYVHGAAGIGKTALLRAAAERAAEVLGHDLVWIDGRDIAPVPDQFEDALGAPPADGRPLVVLDGFEHVEALGGYLRRVLLPALPPGAAVLIASRRAPGPDWAPRAETGFLTLTLALAPLDPSASTELLRQHGLGAGAAARARDWAHGNPLALELAAAADSDPGSALEDVAGLDEDFVERLLAQRLQGPHLATLATAAIARVTTPGLLADALLGADPEAEWDWPAASASPRTNWSARRSASACGATTRWSSVSCAAASPTTSMRSGPVRRDRWR
jgi:hypothetical protein